MSKAKYTMTMVHEFEQWKKEYKEKHEAAIKQLNDVADFLVQSHAFDIKELKEQHKKELGELRDEIMNLKETKISTSHTAFKRIKEIFNKHLDKK